MLDSEFNSELGRPAYPRLMILGLCLFGEEKGIQYLSELNRTCYTDDVFKTLINDRVPSRNIFSNFLDWNDEIIFLSVFSLHTSQNKRFMISYPKTITIIWMELMQE